MKIGAGAFVRAARSHESAGVSCQDRALTRVEHGRALAVISDGCSSGTDSGACAALLASSALAEWGRSGSCTEALDRDWGAKSWSRTQAAMELAGMDAAAHPATLLGAALDAATGRLDVALWGDGAVAIVDAHGSIVDLWLGQSALNMPAYPSYAFCDRMWGSFIKAGGCCSWTRLASPAPRLMVQTSSDGRHWMGKAELGEGEMVLLLSDGCGSVEGLGIEQCVACLAEAKGPGGFIERRARKAVGAWMSEGRFLGDDFSVAALRRDVERGDGS